MKLAQFLLAVLLAGSIVAGQRFSYLRIGPLFVTDAVLFVLLALCGLLRPRWLVVRSRVENLILAYLVLATVHTATALDRGQATLHDAAFAGYALFALVVPAIIVRREQIQQLATLGLGATIVLAATVAAHPELGGTTAFFLGAAALALLSAFTTRFRWVWALLVAVLGMEMTLSGSRATLVGFTIGTGVLLLSLAPRTRRRALRAVATAACCGLLLAGIAVSSAAASRGLRAGTARFVSGTVGYRNDNTAQWRLATWRNTLHMIGRHPLTGVGFGVPVMVYATAEPPEKIPNPYNYGLPHNTFLTAALRMGLPGLALLLAILGTWLGNMWRLRRHTPMAAALVALGVYACCYGCFGLFFERPFMAMPFWTLVGLGLALERQSVGAPA